MRDQARAAVLQVPGVAAVDVQMTARVREAVGGDGTRSPMPGRQERDRGRRRQGRRRQDDGGGQSRDRAGEVRRASVGLIDADIYGPNVPIMLGMKTQLITDGQKIVPAEKYGLQVISMGFLTGDDAPIIWRGPMLHGALQQFFREVRWTDLDYLVVDMPPGTGDVALSLSQTVPVAGVDRRHHAAAGVARRQPPRGGDVQEAQHPADRHHREHEPTSSARTAPTRPTFSATAAAKQMAAELGIPFLGRVPIYQPIREGSDSGVPLMISEPGFTGCTRVHGGGRADGRPGFAGELQSAGDDSADRREVDDAARRRRSCSSLPAASARGVHAGAGGVNDARRGAAMSRAVIDPYLKIRDGAGGRQHGRRHGERRRDRHGGQRPGRAGVQDRHGGRCS